MIILVPLLVGIIGCITYALASNPKIQEMGRIAFFCGLLALVLSVSGQSITLFK